MKTIDVYLRLSSHPVFKYLANYPPAGVNYDTRQKSFTLKSSSPLTKSLKKKIWKIITGFRPPYVHVDIGDNQLIHSCHGMLISNKDPWVVDVEHAPSFANYNVRGLLNNGYKNKIIKLLASDSCKKIIPWTHAAKRSVELAFKNKNIDQKLQVVYPAIDLKKVEIKRDPSTIKFLVTSRFFYEKGGKQALEVFEALDKKYDVEIALLSIVPEEVKRKYRKFKNVKFVEKIFVTSSNPNSIFEDFYSKYDVLFNLTFADTFGLASLEAMSCSMPIIGTDMFSMREVIEDGKNGFVVKSPIEVLNKDFSIKYHTQLGNMDQFMHQLKAYHKNFVKEAASKAAILIEDSVLRKRMGGYGRKLVESGKFSIAHRNRQLRRVYEEVTEG